MNQRFMLITALALLPALNFGSQTAHAATLTGRATINAASANDPLKFVAQRGAQTRLKALLGPVNYRFFQKDFRTVATLQLDRNVAAVSGCRPHDCSSYGSLVVYDRQHDAFKVWLTTGGSTKAFQEPGWRAQNMLNSDMRAALSNLN